MDQLLEEVKILYPEVKEPPSGHIHFKTTESISGFIVYAAQTHPALMPHMKGIYLTLNSWRPQQDEEGWKNPNKRKRETKEDPLPSASVGILEPPEWTKEVPRLRSDIGELMELTLSVSPPQIPIQPTNKEAVYVVGDALIESARHRLVRT